jgi:hypothetical protein
MKRTKDYVKHIACLESIWFDDVENRDRVSVIHVLELISKNYEGEVQFSHLTCNTEQEFIYNLSVLKKLRKETYGILYLAFHGQPGEIHLADGTKINLEKLADLMGKGFADWVVHFGSCGTVDVSQSRLAKFTTSTQVLLVAGYTKDVDWMESAAMDLLFLDRLQDYKDMSRMWSALTKKGESLMKATGLKIAGV